VSKPIQAASGSTTYNVGPGQTYTNLNGVPWLSLKAGDVVNIYYSPTPYATIIAMTAMGTANAPITINGVTDASCHRPVLTGMNAVIANDAQASGYWTKSPGMSFLGFGLINFCFSGYAPSGLSYSPSYLNIQNLEITGAVSGNSYMGPSGATAWHASYGIYAVEFSNVNIQNNYIHDNDGGVFFNAQDIPRTSTYVTMRSNILTNNGTPNNALNHSIYGQGYRTLYEGNYLGQEISSASGSTLKDRSSGTVIRYNYIVSSARAIDLVDSESSPTVVNDPLYNYAWVYGNVIVDDFSLPLNSVDLIHWGGDSGVPSNYRNGTLFAYYNTIILSHTSEYVDVGIFDMPTTAQTTQANSNVFYGIYGGATSSYPFYPLSFTMVFGTFNMNDVNYVTYLNNSNFSVAPYGASSFKNYPAQPPGTAPAGVTFNVNGTILKGSSPSLNANFTPMSTAPFASSGVQFPSTLPVTGTNLNLANLKVVAQFGNAAATPTAPNGNPTIIARPSVSTLGALQP